jgi:hypothetical protein
MEFMGGGDLFQLLVNGTEKARRCKLIPVEIAITVLSVPGSSASDYILVNSSPVDGARANTQGGTGVWAKA